MVAIAQGACGGDGVTWGECMLRQVKDSSPLQEVNRVPKMHKPEQINT